MSYSYVLQLGQELLRKKEKTESNSRFLNQPWHRSQKTALPSRVDKRVLDITISLIALFFLWPIMLMVALLLKLTEEGPVLFSQERIGFNGRSFKCYKFRTMVVGAQDKLERLLQEDPEAAREWRETQKLKNDPRITQLGYILRKTSLDELPQLFNILRGEMSAVGPRPILKEELVRYGKSARYYLSVRPGLTGLWQVSGRNSVDYHHRVVMDRCYVCKWSMLCDILIILKTPVAVIRTAEAS